MNARINPFRGTGIALVTPFTLQNEVDYPALKRLVNHCIDGGVEFLVALGTTAETATLTADEKQRVVAAVCDAAAGRVPVVQGVGGNDSAKVAAELKAGLRQGISGVLSVSPYYNKPTQEGIYRHFIHVSAATDLPIILYNVPGRTGSNMAAETTLRIAQEVPHAVAIKEASGSLDQVGQVRHLTPSEFAIYSGDDSLTLPMLSLGSYGVVRVASHLVGEQIQQMIQAFVQGKAAEATNIHLKLLDLFKSLFLTTNPIPIKTALKLQGWDVGSMRSPLDDCPADITEKLKVVMSALDLL